MTVVPFDLAAAYRWNEGLPLVPWDLVQEWADQHVAPEQLDDVWTALTRQWLEKMAQCLKRGYTVCESTSTQFLLPPPATSLEPLLPFAEKCQRELLAGLRGVTEFTAPGKQVVLVLQHQDDYYRYLSAYYEEGHHGGSSGMHIRSGYSHIVLWGMKLETLESVLAHELTHASLQHRQLPQWLEEGLAQCFECWMSVSMMLEVNVELARTHKAYWSENSLDVFWYGDGFSMPGEVQKLCYQLAEILVRLLMEEHRPRWFGLKRERHQRFLSFLQDANSADCGAAAAEKHLRFGLEKLVGRFLGELRDVPGG